MSSVSPYVKVARVVKARGRKGEVVVHCADSLPFCLYEGLAVHIVPPQLAGVRHTTVTAVGGADATAGTVCLDGVATMEDAEALAGRWLLARRDDVDLTGAAWVDLLLGREIVDEGCGTLGSVAEVIETPANDVAVVQGVRGEVLVPLVDEFIVELSEDVSQPIRMRLPEGLVG